MRKKIKRQSSGKKLNKKKGCPFMFKLQIKSLCCRIVLVFCWLIPMSACEGIFTSPGTYFLICLASMVAGFLSYNGYVHADNKIARLRKKNILYLNNYQTSAQEQAA